MTSIRRTFISIVGLAALTGTALAGNTPDPGTITNIEGAMHGDWTLTQSSYIPASQDGHFGLDTLAAFESVPGEVTNPTDGSTRPAERWSDLWIKVYRTRGSDAGSMIAVDKEVLNLTDFHWTDFHMELGIGVGSEFQPLDGLTFKTEPSALEETGAFPNPPMYGPAGAAPTSLWWLEDPTNGYDGVAAGGISLYWVGINIPLSAFGPDTNGEVAMFTVRQHWTPSPGAAGVFGLAGVAALRRRRRA
jgi:MYXO-CTERM domain-containing protein